MYNYIIASVPIINTVNRLYVIVILTIYKYVLSGIITAILQYL